MRSTDPRDYQSLAQPVALMSKLFPAGYRVEPHTHARDQLLYAASGTMHIRTAQHAWLVPPDRALYMPAGFVHSVAMHGPVEMRTLYIAPGSMPGLPREPRALAARELLRALIDALFEEPVEYGVGSRGDRVARLILDEIVRAEPLALSIPMPRDRRLLRVCEGLIAAPESGLSLEDWARAAGASARTLARLFQSECGMSFSAFRQRVRLHAAIDALSRGMPVGAVARDHGYRSASAFSAAFRAALGVTPKSVAGPARSGSKGTGT